MKSKITKFMLLLTLLLAGFTITASAASSRWIGTNTSYSDYCSSNDDENWYQFSVSKAGYVSVSFGKGYDSDSYHGWKVALFDANKNQIMESEYTCGNTNTETTCKIGVQSGSYYVRVMPRWTSNSVWTSVRYTVKVNYTASNVWETEFNDSLGSADYISTNTTYYGSMRHTEDIDYYKFNTTKNGYVTLSFGKDYDSDSYHGWKVALFDVNNNQIMEREYTCGNTATETTCKIGIPSGSYYVRVTPRWNSWWTSVRYKLKVNYVASTRYESEFNDSPDKADALQAGTARYGSIADDDDIDYYKVHLGSSANYLLQFGKGMAESGGWYVKIYNAQMEEIKSYDVYAGNTKTENLEWNYLRAGTYYIKVNRGWGDTVDVGYFVNLTSHLHYYRTAVYKATPTKNGKIVKRCSGCGATAGTTTIYYPKTIKLSTTTYTYDGRVKRPSVSVKNSAGKTISSNYYTVTYSSGRKYVGTYKAVITFKGLYSGKVTRYFKIAPKSTSITKILPRYRSFGVYWNRQSTQTSGYEVQYSRYSNFKTSATRTVAKNTATSTTISGKPSGIKYYVKVRTYKVVSGTRRYSSWSAVKAVRTR